MSKLNRRTKADQWLERTNPLLGLSLRAAQGIYDAARGKGSALLQRIYAEIEAADPVLMTCVDRRGSALAGLGWRAVADSDAADAVLADEQKDFISRLAAGIGNFTEAVEHLDLAFFRGYSHVQPVWEGGVVRHIAALDSWNFLREGGRWYWNPDCRGGTEGLEEVTDKMRLVTVTRPRAIDYPAMSIHIRKALGERDWGRFTERYGLPPVDAVMGAGATDEQRAEYLQAAEAARDGLPVVWPAGSQVSRAEGARGQDPFSAFIEHQEKLVVLMATGGTLTSLAQADTGALAGGAQMDVWEQIVRRDAAIIGDALDRRLFRPALEAAFPGKAAAAHFELGRDAEPDAGELFDLAAKARTAGYRVEKSTLEEESGYTLVEDTPAQPGGFGGFGNSATPLQLHAKALQNARRGEGATTAPPEGETRSASILRDFAADMGPAAEKINLLLKRLDAGEDVREDAARLAEELPSLMPGDPAMAAVLEEAMAEEFAAVADKTSPFRSDIEDERMNSGEEEEEFVLINDNDNRDKDGQFAEKGTGNQTGGPHETNLEKRQRTCQEALDKFNASTDHPSDDDVASGKVSIEEALEKGFSTTFAGHKLVFFTKQKITDKYVGFKDDPGRIKLVKEAVEKKNRMQPRPHNGEQTAFVESTKTSAPASKLLVVVADTKTGVVVSIMKAPVEYVGKHFK